MLNEILPKAIAADKAVALAKKEKRELNAADKALLAEVESIVNDLVQVNSFDRLGAEKFEDDNFVRPALRNTRFAHMKVTSNAAVSTA